MIVLIGFMGAGKTSVGRELAALMELPFIDTDDLIEQAEGRRIQEIFAVEGEPYFRDVEKRIVLEALAGRDAVVALGGGAPQDVDVRPVLSRAEVVYLEAGLDECLRRIGDDTDRPLLRDADVPTLFRDRANLYESVAGRKVSTVGRTPREVAEEIAGRVSVDPEMRKVTVELGDRSYDVSIGRNLMSRLTAFLPADLRPEKAFIVTHPSLVGRAAAVRAAFEERSIETHVLDVPEGETSKSWEAAGELLEQMAAAEAHRNDLVIAFGGGVVTDLGGFVASTYARGVGLVQVPTSLLAQVDAAIGGKTGVNLRHGKNLAGAFYQPRAVVCDVELLRELPDEEFTSGMAEVLKYGFIDDPTILGSVTDDAAAIARREPAVLIDLVEASVEVKARIVAADERESGIRTHLNYGHTFAHAIELSTGYGNVRHGEAVALGMMAAAYLAQELGWIDDGVVTTHRATLQAAGLPVVADLRFADLEAAWRRDKKYDEGVRFVLLKALGEPHAGVESDRESIERALERMGT